MGGRPIPGEHYVEIDLQRLCLIEKVVIDWEDGYSDSWTIQVSQFYLLSYCFYVKDECILSCFRYCFALYLPINTDTDILIDVYLFFFGFVIGIKRHEHERICYPRKE